MLAVRVRHDNVRALITDVQEAFTDCMFAKTEEQSDQYLAKMLATGNALNQRIGELLRRLDEDEDVHLPVTRQR
jgi:hypothetical protein